MTNLSILLVEDNVSFGVEIEMIIDELGYELIDIINNAREALTAIEEKKPDLIIADISLKGDMNGIQMIEKIKDNPAAVIFITQYRDDNFYNQAKSLRPVAYLVKPFDKFTLQSCIETAFQTLSAQNNETTESSSPTDHYLIEDSFFIKKNGILTKVRIVDIQSLQSDGNYCEIILINEKKFVIKMSLSNVLKKLPVNHFIRIHQRYAVQTNLIDGVDTLDNKIQIGGLSYPMGRTYKEMILKQIKKLS